MSRTKTPPNFQIDDKGREQSFGPSGFQGDDFQPGADIFNVAGIDPDLPFRCGPGQLRMLETEKNQLFNKGIHQGMVIKLEDFPGHGDDTIQDRAAVLGTGGTLFKEIKDFSDISI